MATPTVPTTGIIFSKITGTSFRLNYTIGDGNKRLVTLSEEVKYPVDGIKYTHSLKYKNGGKLFNDQPSGVCQDLPYLPVYPPNTSEFSKSFVIYDGVNDGVVGLDILNLYPKTTYYLMVFEHNNACYLPSSIYEITTGFNTNTEIMRITIYDSRTRLPIQYANIALMDTQSVLSDFGETDSHGLYQTLSLQEGRYELSVVASGYESKVISGLFIQRAEPRRDNLFSVFSSAGFKENGTTVERKYHANRNEHIIYLDPDGVISPSFTRYQPSPNPSNLTKL